MLDLYAVCVVCGKPAAYWTYDSDTANIIWNGGRVTTSVPHISKGYCGLHAPYSVRPVNTLEQLYAEARDALERAGQREAALIRLAETLASMPDIPDETGRDWYLPLKQVAADILDEIHASSQS